MLRRHVFFLTIVALIYTSCGGADSSPTAPTLTITSIALSTSAVTLGVGDAVTLTATATYSDGTTATISPTWTSSNTSVATVTTSGTVTALAAGTTTITATSGGQTGSVVITVTELVSLLSVSVSADATSLTVGETATVTATATYSDGTTSTISPTWASSNTSVATVTTSGTVTALAAGTTTITATSDGQSGSVAITVTAATLTWRGLVIADEDRCSPYDSGDYSYPQSVEDDIITLLGGIYSPYTGECFASQSETDIEHMLARSEAHDSGLCAADEETRRTFSRDLDNLTLASPSLNRYQKSAKDAADWLPDQNRCWFVTTIINVRLKYGLTIDQREADAIDVVLASCTSTELVPTTCDLPRPSAIWASHPDMKRPVNHR